MHHSTFLPLGYDLRSFILLLLVSCGRSFVSSFLLGTSCTTLLLSSLFLAISIRLVIRMPEHHVLSVIFLLLLGGVNGRGCRQLLMMLGGARSSDGFHHRGWLDRFILDGGDGHDDNISALA